MQVMANRVLIKIKRADRERDTIKEIIRDDGTKTHIYLGNDYKMEAVQGGSARLVQVSQEDDRSSQIFARFGEVIQTGRNVTEMEAGDIAILDYKVDNDESILVESHKDYKLVAPIGVTTYTKEDKVAAANRKFPKDRILAKKGEIEMVADIHGVIRDGKILAVSPYVILKYTPVSVKKMTKLGIVYDEPIRILETEVVAISETSTGNFGITKGAKIKVKEPDVFKVDIKEEPYYICNDSDIMSIAYESMEEVQEIIR